MSKRYCITYCANNIISGRIASSQFLSSMVDKEKAIYALTKHTDVTKEQVEETINALDKSEYESFRFLHDEGDRLVFQFMISKAPSVADYVIKNYQTN